jgi:hypothetical protein
MCHVPYNPCNARPPLDLTPLYFALQTTPLLSLTSPSLGLLLVFRTNAAYARWTEARALWSTVNARSWDLMRQVVRIRGCVRPLTSKPPFTVPVLPLTHHPCTPVPIFHVKGNQLAAYLGAQG